MFRLVSRVNSPAWALAIRDGVLLSSVGFEEVEDCCLWLWLWEVRRWRFGPNFCALEVDDWRVSPGRTMVGDAIEEIGMHCRAVWNSLIFGTGWYNWL